MIGEFGRAVRAVHFAWLNSPHSFNQLIVIRMIGQRQRVIDPQAILSIFVHRPTRDRDGNRFAQPRQPEFAGGPRQRDDDVAVKRLAVEQGVITQIDSAPLVNTTDFVNDAVLQYRHAVQC